MGDRKSRVPEGAIATSLAVGFAAVGPYLNSVPAVAAAAGAAGASVVYAASILRPIASREMTRLGALKRKLREDLVFSPMTSWAELEKARREVSTRQLSRGGPPSITQRFGISRNSLKRSCANSTCWSGIPSTGALDALRAYGPVRVSTESIHPGVDAALLVMREDFGIQIEQARSPYSGVEQVESLNAGGEADFLIVADANMALASCGKTLMLYRYLFPCFSQRQFVVDKVGVRTPSGRRLIVGASSTGQEQSLYFPGSIPGRPITDHEQVTIGLLGAAIPELSAGESIIIWDPIVSMFAMQPELNIHRDAPFWFSTSLYCHRSLCAGAGPLLRDAFLDCFIAAWNVARAQPRVMLIRLLFDVNFWSRFCDASDGQEFILPPEMSSGDDVSPMC